MLARTSASLATCGPMFVMVILLIETCAKAVAVPSHAQTASKRNRARLFAWHVVTADFGRTLKPRIGLQKRQVHVPGGTVSLLGNQQIHRHSILFLGAVVVFAAARLVKHCDQIGILLDRARFAQVREPW